MKLKEPAKPLFPPQWVHYRLSFTELNRQLIEVEVTLKGFESFPKELFLKMPRWSPGWYWLEENSKFLQEPALWARGKKFEKLRKVNHFSWKIDNWENDFKFSYKIFGGKWSDDGCWVSPEHISFLGTTVFIQIQDFQNFPHVVHIESPKSFKNISTSLRELKTGHFLAEDFDELVDSPVEIGNHPIDQFNSGDIPMAIAWVGKSIVPMNRKKIAEDFKSLTEKIIRRMGGAPFDRYLFIVHFVPKPMGSLEHKSSTSLTITKYALKEGENYNDFLSLVTHEFFHAWNVKTIRPKGLVPLDYFQEQHLDTLWFFEGFTTYIDQWLPMRENFSKPTEFFKNFGKFWGRMKNTPGENIQSLDESSFDCWVKFNTDQPNQMNTEVNFYIKGFFVAFCADIELLSNSSGKIGIMDVFKQAYKEAQIPGYSGHDQGDILKIFQKISGNSYSQFFKKMINSRTPLDVVPFLNKIGLYLKPIYPSKGDPLKNGGLKIGMDPDSETRIDRVHTGSAASKSGLLNGDEIIGLNGVRIRKGFKSALAAYPPGEKVELLISRQDEIQNITVTIEEITPEGYDVELKNKPLKGAQTLFKQWAGHPISSLKS